VDRLPLVLHSLFTASLVDLPVGWRMVVYLFTVSLRFHILLSHGFLLIGMIECSRAGRRWWLGDGDERVLIVALATCAWSSNQSGTFLSSCCSGYCAANKCRSTS
jgi:hypothetical protein